MNTQPAERHMTGRVRTTATPTPPSAAPRPWPAATRRTNGRRPPPPACRRTRTTPADSCPKTRRLARARSASPLGTLVASTYRAELRCDSTVSTGLPRTHLRDPSRETILASCHFQPSPRRGAHAPACTTQDALLTSRYAPYLGRIASCQSDAAWVCHPLACLACSLALAAFGSKAPRLLLDLTAVRIRQSDGGGGGRTPWIGHVGLQVLPPSTGSPWPGICISRCGAGRYASPWAAA